MKEIWARDKRLGQFIRSQKIRTNENYKWSQFVLPIVVDGKSYLFNLWTKQCFETDLTFEKNETFAPSRIASSPDLTTLTEEFFLAPSSRDECAFYEGYSKLIRVALQRRTISAYTILPTTACNARCVYCYEKGLKPVSMTRETAEKVVDFIVATRCKDKPLHLAWFGGEPLLGEAIIDQICAGMVENGIDFYSTMVTNGSLLNRSLIEKAQTTWNLERVQVSMDGAENDYLLRKNYLRGENNYRKVIENVNLLAERKIQTTIRVNADQDNLEGMDCFLDDVASGVADKSQVAIYLTPLFAAQDSDQSVEIWGKCLQFQRRSLALGFAHGNVTNLRRYRVAFCMAETPYSSVVISPDKLFYNCEHCVPGTDVGSLDDGFVKKDVLESFLYPESAREKCRECPFLPECTTFSRCPIKLQHCREVKKLQIEYDLVASLSSLRDNSSLRREDSDVC